MELKDAHVRTFSRTLLWTLLALLLLSACVYDRFGWPRPALVSGEATYLMQAESLAYDFDLAYSRRDFDRALLARHGEPPDLELASGSNGRRIAYDRPFPYALWLAPFVRLWPDNGFAVANAFLLALAGLFAVSVLKGALGVSAPAWVAVLLFASVAWNHVFMVTGDLFLMCVVVVAFGLIVRARPAGENSSGRRSGYPWLFAGTLLAVPLATEPLYAVLAVAAFFAVPRTGSARATFLMGLALSLLLQVGLQWWWSGGLHFVGTTRFRFTPATGFPLVDFTDGDWSQSVRRFKALYWDEAPRFSWGVDPRVWLWNVVYVVLGRHIGLLPYFAPLVTLLAGASFEGYRRLIAIAAGVWIVAMIVLHPFNLYGGEGAIANRLFLPVYGALWFVLTRRPRVGWSSLTVVLSVVFLWNLWTSPWSYPISRSGGYGYVAPAAARILPYETSQRWIPVNQQADHLGLRLRLLNEGVWAETGRERLVLDAERRARMIVASPVKLPSLDLEFGSDAPGELTVRGARLEETVLLPDGGITFRLRPTGGRRHAVWWSPERQWHYLLDFELPGTAGADGSLGFQLFSETVLMPVP